MMNRLGNVAQRKPTLLQLSDLAQLHATVRILEYLGIM